MSNFDHFGSEVMSWTLAINHATVTTPILFASSVLTNSNGQAGNAMCNAQQCRFGDPAHSTVLESFRENQGDVRARVDCTQHVNLEVYQEPRREIFLPIGTVRNQTEEFPTEKSSTALQALWRHINLQPLLLHPDLWSFGLQEGPFSFHGTVTRPRPCCLTGVGTTAQDYPGYAG